MTTTTEKRPAQAKQDHNWLIYGAGLLAGVLLLAEAFGYAPLQKLPARLGVALIYSALAMFVAKGKAAGIIATILLWAAVVVTFFV